MKGLTKTIELEGRTITVRELTFGEIQLWEREIEESIKKSTAGAADMMLMENYSPSDLLRMTSLTAADLEEFPPSVMDQVYNACLEVNGRFFVLRAHLLRPLKIAIECLGSIGTPAPSSGMGTRIYGYIRGVFTSMRSRS
jgi:hypothetical protein